MAGLGDYDKKTKGSRGYTMKGNPIQRNFGIGSPLHDEKDKDKTPEKPHWNYGSVNEKGDKIVNEQGNWVSLKKGTEGKMVQDRAIKDKTLSGTE